jgi:hypothetical protein
MTSSRGMTRNGMMRLNSMDVSLSIVSLITLSSSTKSMEIREYLIDLVLTVVMIISTLVLILRFWQDLTIAIAAVLMMLSLGGLFLSMQVKVRRLERSVISRERMLRFNLEEISKRMAEKHDMAITHLDELIAEYSKRVYR